MTVLPEIDDLTAARHNVARRILFCVLSSERLLGLPPDAHGKLDLKGRCERILRAAQRGGLEAGLYSLVWSIFRAPRIE